MHGSQLPKLRYAPHTPCPVGTGGFILWELSWLRPPAPAGWWPRCVLGPWQPPQGRDSLHWNYSRTSPSLPVPPAMSGPEWPALLVIAAASSLEQSGRASKELFSIPVLCAAVSRGSNFCFETGSYFLKSRKAIYLISPPLSWELVINRALQLCLQCSLCPWAAEQFWEGHCCCWLHPHCCPSAHFQCTSSFPFSQEDFWIPFTHPLLLFLFPTIL